MYDVERNLKNIDKAICDHLECIDTMQRGMIANSMLSNARHLVEHIALKIYSEDNMIDDPYEGIKAAMEFLKHKNEYLYLRKFHGFLQQVASHYVQDYENSERLILKYYEYFLHIKKLVKDRYNMEILHNIDRFPIYIDKTMQEYYEKIAAKLSTIKDDPDFIKKGQRFYVQKTKAFFVNGKVYYENTLTLTHDSATKFDRFVVFSRYRIPSYYAIRVSMVEDEIDIANGKMPVKIVTSWVTSIRPCELNNFSKILNFKGRIESNHAEYIGIMNYLVKSGDSLVDIVAASEKEYQRIKQEILLTARSINFMEVMDRCRELIQADTSGANVVRYLLHTLRNKTIKSQLDTSKNEHLSNLKLRNGCIPFDKMPFATSLIDHNPLLADVFEAIPYEGREHELLAKRVNTNSVEKKQLYIKVDVVLQEGNIDALIEKYNDLLYRTHQGRRLELFGKNIFVRENEQDAIFIIKTLIEFAKTGIVGYHDSAKAWLEDKSEKAISDEKKTILENLFISNRVALIYGAAGTGKTRLIECVSELFSKQKKLYLANTNPALQNLKRRVKVQNCEFYTIAKFSKSNRIDVNYDILFVDECSMVSNSDMRKVLAKINCKLLVLVGDTYQIEAIKFGNWFNMAKYFIAKTACQELIGTFRTEKAELLTLWDKVRKLKEDISEHMATCAFSARFDDSVFRKTLEDEIILCLNYDGLYGINNINRFLQRNNPNKGYRWGIWTYKIADPILFNENERFQGILYNNLKGRILNIELGAGFILFTIEIDEVLNEIDIQGVELELLSSVNPKKSVVRFAVYENDDDDNDSDDERTIVPFQIAYAVSIHKAQGLEYDSVKVIITEEVDEMISHNIFYTAITRAKSKLKIYWTPESQHKVISGFVNSESTNDVVIFEARTGIKRVRK